MASVPGPAWLPLRGPLLAVAAVLCLVAGGITGVASVAVHNASWAWLLLAIAAPLAALVALRPGWLRVGFAAGWLLLLAIALQGRPEGDYAVQATVRGYLLLTCGLAVIVTTVTTLPVRRHAGESECDATGT